MGEEEEMRMDRTGSTLVERHLEVKAGQRRSRGVKGSQLKDTFNEESGRGESKSQQKSTRVNKSQQESTKVNESTIVNTCHEINVTHQKSIQVNTSQPVSVRTRSQTSPHEIKG